MTFRALGAAAMVFLAVNIAGASRAKAASPACSVIARIAATASLSATGGVERELIPKDMGSSSTGIGSDADSLANNLDAYMKGTSLTAFQIEDLKRRAVGHDFGGYKPDCKGFAKPAAFVESGQVMTSEFTRPLFSSDGKIAVVAWSLKSGGRWGHG